MQYNTDNKTSCIPVRDITVSTNGLAGLLNMGNTCYLNSVLQVLSNIPKFREYFMSKEYHTQLISYVKKMYCDINNLNNYSEIAIMIPNTLSYQFERLFKAIWNHDNEQIPIYRPLTFRKLIASKYKHFDNYIQQDAHECISAIFDIVEQETGSSVEVNPEYTQEEFITFNVLDKGYEELESLKDNYDTYANKRVNIRLLEDNYPGLIKRYRQLQYLTSKYAKTYSICDELFCVGQINCLECSNCQYKSYNFSDNTCIFLEIPENSFTEEDIKKAMKSVTFSFEKHNVVVEEAPSIKSIFEDVDDEVSSTVSSLNIYDEFDKFLDSDTDDSDTQIDKIIAKAISSDDNINQIECSDDDNDNVFGLFSNIFEKPKVQTPTIPPVMLEKIRRDRAINNLMETQQYSLYDCLDLTFKAEDLDMMLTCNYCNTKSNMKKTNKFWNIPKYLIVQLKRFDIMTATKKSHLVNFGETIDISKYIDEDLPDHLKISTKYNLIGVINHSGGLSSGHYYAFAKNSINNQWFSFNDQNIGNVQTPITAEAYILVYENDNDNNI